MALLECGMELDIGSSSYESRANLLIDEACQPVARQRLQEIGPERLSPEQLQSETRERGFEPDDLSRSTRSKAGRSSRSSGGIGSSTWLPDARWTFQQ